MQSRTTRRFGRLFSDLHMDVQPDAPIGFSGFAIQEIRGRYIYSARIGLDYRALAVMKKGL